MAESKYSKEEIQKILNDRKFEYHRVDLPYGLHTKGQSRQDTKDLIFPHSLEGKSVLDIGCALGYMCFEAEKKGASQVTGVDIKQSRLDSALILKDILSSNVEFRLQDVLNEPVEESYDNVLCLNVIHHLVNPIKVLHDLASITKERLVLEFPTLEDHKFNRSFWGKLGLGKSEQPYIGVSLTKEGQTFVFNPDAIKRMLTDHANLFQSVEFIESPMKGRMIAFCYKE